MRSVALAVLVTGLAIPPAAQSSQTLVTFTVPPSQAMAGPAALTLAPGLPRTAHLRVQSNIPWVLRAEVDGGAVTWRPSPAGPWRRLHPGAVLRAGPRGVHAVAAEFRAAAPATVRFLLQPAP